MFGRVQWTRKTSFSMGYVWWERKPFLSFLCAGAVVQEEQIFIFNLFKDLLI